MWEHWGDDAINALNVTLYWVSISLWVVIVLSGPVFLIYAACRLIRERRNRVHLHKEFNHIVKDFNS